MPGIISSYRSCMMPRSAILGWRSDMSVLHNDGARAARRGAAGLGAGWSALPVLLLVTPVQRVDLFLAERGERVAEGTGQVHGPGGVLAHHRRLHGVAGGRADGEHAVTAHQHGGRPLSAQGGPPTPPHL